jgi:Holliday junction DNA helicase RuvB
MVAQRRSVFTTADSTTLRATVDLELKEGISAEELDLIARNGARIEGLGARATAFALAGLADGGCEQLGYSSTTRYAEIQLGQAPTTARERVAIGRALRDLPALQAALDDERVSWSQVRAVARVATAETDAAWAAWAKGRTARETAAHCKSREKGQLPTDPQRRTIHTTKLKVTGLLDVVQMEIWNNARAKLEASRGGPVSDTEMLMEAANFILSQSPDGTAPGWRPVNDSHFKVVIRHGDGTDVHTEDGAVSLDGDTARAVLHEAGRDDLAETVPSSERDRPTPPWLRDRVLDRDGRRCLCCGSKDNLSVDHIKERRHGGRTEASNLQTLDETCHSMKTDGLIRVEGDPEASPGAANGLRFTDRCGRDLGRREPTGLKVKTTAGERTDARASVVTFNDLPQDCDAEWWARHAHLLTWSERRGVLEFDPGFPLAEAPDARASVASPPGDARASRPVKLADFVGQRRVVQSLETAVRVARELDKSMPHLLLQGPGGLGKTSFARAVANELGGGFHPLSAPLISEFGVLLRCLTSLRRDGEIVFIDEIHRLPERLAVTLYESLEDGRLSVEVVCGRGQRTLHLRLPRFTLIGATTDEQRLPRPFRSRFQSQTLEFYSLEEISELLRRTAARESVQIDDDATRLLAGVSRDTPREALALMSSACDEARLDSRSTIDGQKVRRVLERRGIDEHGLTTLDRRCLKALEEGPLGCRTLAGRLGISTGKLVEVVEPHLIRRGLIVITRRGRSLAW